MTLFCSGMSSGCYLEKWLSVEYTRRLYGDVGRHVSRCKKCVMVKDEEVKTKIKLGTIQASRPWGILAMDFVLLDPARDEKENKSNIYTFSVHLGTQEVTFLVEEIFIGFGVLEKLHNDQGLTVESLLVQELCEYHGISKYRSSLCFPGGKGTCERVIRALHGVLVTLKDEQREQRPRYWSSLTAKYSSTQRLVTGFLPHSLVFVVELNLPLDLFGEERTRMVDTL